MGRERLGGMGGIKRQKEGGSGVYKGGRERRNGREIEREMFVSPGLLPVGLETQR